MDSVAARTTEASTSFVTMPALRTEHMERTTAAGTFGRCGGHDMTAFSAIDQRHFGFPVPSDPFRADS